MQLSKSKDQSKELENYIGRLNVLFTKYKTIEDGSVKSMLIITYIKTSISTTVIMVNSLRDRFKFNLICRKRKEKRNQKSCRRENRYRIIMLATFSNLTVSDYVRSIKIYTNLPLALQDSCQFYDNIYDITGVTMSLESHNQQDTYLIVSRAYLHEM